MRLIIKCVPFQGKESSKALSLVHGDTVTLGSTTLSMHIHKGLEVCTYLEINKSIYNREINWH